MGTERLCQGRPHVPEGRAVPHLPVCDKSVHARRWIRVVGAAERTDLEFARGCTQVHGREKKAESEYQDHHEPQVAPNVLPFSGRSGRTVGATRRDAVLGGWLGGLHSACRESRSAATAC